jgi:hypothetical protein
MTYNKPVLMNVDTAFNVVLGIGTFEAKDHLTDVCRSTESGLTSDDKGCPL